MDGTLNLTYFSGASIRRSACLPLDFSPSRFGAVQYYLMLAKIFTLPSIVLLNYNPTERACINLPMANCEKRSGQASFPRYFSIPTLHLIQISFPHFYFFLLFLFFLKQTARSNNALGQKQPDFYYHARCLSISTNRGKHVHAEAKEREGVSVL